MENRILKWITLTGESEVRVRVCDTHQQALTLSGREQDLLAENRTCWVTILAGMAQAHSRSRTRTISSNFLAKLSSGSARRATFACLSSLWSVSLFIFDSCNPGARTCFHCRSVPDLILLSASCPWRSETGALKCKVTRSLVGADAEQLERLGLAEAGAPKCRRRAASREDHSHCPRNSLRHPPIGSFFLITTPLEETSSHGRKLVSQVITGAKVASQPAMRHPGPRTIVAEPCVVPISKC